MSNVRSRVYPPHSYEDQRRFLPPTEELKPLDLFSLKLNRCSISGKRYIDNNDPGTMLMFIDGACLNNGRPDARAGFGVAFRETGNISGRLEKPPPGTFPTSNRAELRSVLGALQLRFWPGEGFRRIVLATDSEYLVLGVCERLKVWKRNGWKTSNNTSVKNRDLWEMIDAELHRWEDEEDVQVQFWLIPREWNPEADGLAKLGALEAEPEAFTKILAI